MMCFQCVKNFLKMALKIAGDSAGLYNLGFPLAVVVQLQQMVLSLGSALWTAKNSGSRFSVSLFLPTVNMATSKPMGKKKKKRRKRKKVASAGVRDNEEPCDGTPIDAHHHVDASQSAVMEVGVVKMRMKVLVVKTSDDVTRRRMTRMG